MFGIQFKSTNLYAEEWFAWAHAHGAKKAEKVTCLTLNSTCPRRLLTGCLLSLALGLALGQIPFVVVNVLNITIQS